MRRRGSLDLSQNRRKTITGTRNATDSAGGDLSMRGAVGTTGRAAIPDMLDMAILNTSMRRERLTHSRKGLDLFCRARICRDTRKTSLLYNLKRAGLPGNGQAGFLFVAGTKIQKTQNRVRAPSCEASVRRSGLVPDNVPDDEHYDHQEGHPNRHFAERPNAWHAPVEGRSLAVIETRLAIPASIDVERADSAAVRARFGIKPIRHE